MTCDVGRAIETMISDGVNSAHGLGLTYTRAFTFSMGFRTEAYLSDFMGRKLRYLETSEWLTREQALERLALDT